MSNDPNSPVIIADRLTEVEAALLIGRLEDAGIVARRAGSGGATGWPEAFGYTQVVIRQADLQLAQDIIGKTAQ